MGVDIDFSPLLGLDPFGEPAVTYYRYSSHGQTEQSIEGQREKAWEYARAKGYNIVHEYCDRAMTGRNDDREDFQRMLSDTAKHKFSVIIVWKVDRFGRNREEITFNKYHCKKNGVRVEYVAEVVPPTPEGVILESVLEGYAEYFSLQLSQNVRRGLRISAEKGQCTGNHPLGYSIGPDKKLVIDPDTAPTVQQIFQLYSEGHTTTEIVNTLNTQGLRTLYGRPFTKNSLRTILKNEKYIGIYTYDDIRLEGAVPPIIDEDTFYKVQKMLKHNKAAPAHKWSKAEYILSGKLFCGQCGAGMVGESGTSKSGTKYSYYLCTRHKQGHQCHKKAVRQEWIEKLVIEKTTQLLQDDELMEFIAENTWQFYLAQDERQGRIDSAAAQLQAVNKSIDNIVRAVEAGMFTPALTARMEELNDEKAALEKTISDEELSTGPRLTKDHIVYFLNQFRGLDYGDRAVQKRLIEVFVNSVFVYDDKITLTFNFSGSSRTITLNEVDSASPGVVFDGCALRSATASPGIG